MNRLPVIAFIGASLGMFGAEAFAASRAFVASVGIDTNPCSLAQPCRSLATAVAVVDAGGEVIVVDSAGYGDVVITKSVSIIAAPGVYAGISVRSGVGISVNPGSTGKVLLRGLTITGGVRWN